MPLSLTEKIISEHTESPLSAGSEIGLKIDQTLTQDATGTMAYLQFETLNVPRVKTQRSVAYIDHNTLQSGFENADDHLYISSVAKKHGIYYSRPGNGICHQVHLERFSKPGQTLIGSDSHTPTCGGIGMLAIGAGGLDVAVAMAGGPYYIPMPSIVKVELKGKLSPAVSAKDIILELLRRLSVKGGVGKIMEYGGEGVLSLSVPERSTITNMGAELGATTSIFPSDEVTHAFLKAQGREEDFIPLSADSNASYSETIVIDLSKLEPLVACPHMPDNVKKVSEIKNLKIDQVCIGSCTNSSYRDLMRVAAILKGKTIHPDVSVSIAPGSKQVFNMLARNGALADLIESGVRILESACGFCIGMGQSPNSNGVSLRTSNRNFEGRSGTKDGQIYLVSPETAAVSALNGVLSDPRSTQIPDIQQPDQFLTNDNMMILPLPESEAKSASIVRGPNIQAFPRSYPIENTLKTSILLKVEDNITTDHIAPAGSKMLPLRSNIPAISRSCFYPVDPTFHDRALQADSGIIVAGANYGQGSSREHAALEPLYLGIKAVIARSFARIHKQNLINVGIVPFEFVNGDDYDLLLQGDKVIIDNIHDRIQRNRNFELSVGDNKIELTCDVSKRNREILLSGGLLLHVAKGEN